MYPLERWTRTYFVCLCLWLSLLFSMQQQGAADSNEWAHGVVSVIASTRGSTQTLARRNTHGSNIYARHAPSAKESSMRGVPRRLRRFASSHDAAFGVGRLRRSAASHRNAAEAARGGNYRIDAVCPFTGIRCALLLHREAQAQPQAKTHEEGSGPTLQPSIKRSASQCSTP